MEALNRRDGFDVKVCTDEPWEDLADVIGDFDPHIFHFIGHGKSGKLAALAIQSAGSPGETLITPMQLSEGLFRGSTSLEGVFLNGCETSYWAPHLIPSGGWFIGANRRTSDAAAALFAKEFYRRLERGSANERAFDDALHLVTNTNGYSQPPIVRWVEDADPANFLQKVFDREAFRASAGRESSMDELCDALEDIRRALRYGRLFTRVDMGNPSIIYCTGKLDAAAVKQLRRLMRDVFSDFKGLRGEFGAVVNLGSDLDRIPRAQRARFLYLADRLDASRNQVIEALWELLPVPLMLDEITLTSEALGESWPTTDAKCQQGQS